MMFSGDYPEGAKFDPNAPWNDSDYIEVDVEATITYSRFLTVKVPEDYSLTDLKDAVKSQWYLPNESGNKFNQDIGERDKKKWEMEKFRVREL